MFTKDSRYASTQTLKVMHRYREITVVKLRNLPVTTGTPLTVNGADQLDVISDRCYQDGTRYWHVADANTELDATEILTPVGRVIQVPEQ